MKKLSEQQRQLLERVRGLHAELNRPAYKEEYIARGTANVEDYGRLSDRLDDELAEAGLPRTGVCDMLAELDTLDGLTYDYGEDVPEDHDSEEYKSWRDDNYYRISGEYDKITAHIADYMAQFD